VGRMRRIVMFNRVTADGYFAGPDGNLEWIVPDEEVDKAGAGAIPGFDTIGGEARDPHLVFPGPVGDVGDPASIGGNLSVRLVEPGVESQALVNGL
jgi:hypothetical protein